MIFLNYRLLPIYFVSRFSLSNLASVRNAGEKVKRYFYYNFRNVRSKIHLLFFLFALTTQSFLINLVFHLFLKAKSTQ